MSKKRDYSPPKDKCWTSKLKVHEGCPYNKVKLMLDEEHMKLIKAMDKEFQKEFSMYFDAQEEEDGSFSVTRIWVPEQEVTDITVDFVVPEEAKGVIHKHPSGAVYFSETDDEHINANHDFSLLLVDGEIKKATARKTMPCGVLMEVEVSIVIMTPTSAEVDEFIESAKTKIKELPDVIIEKKKYVKQEWYDGILCVTCGRKLFNPEAMKKCVKCGDPICVECAYANYDMCKDCLSSDSLYMDTIYS